LAPLAGAATAVLSELVPSAAGLLPQAKRDLDAGGGTAPAAALPVYLREHTAWRRGS
jgi:hypothetical protein